MIHLDKKVQWSSLPALERQGYQGKEDYLRKTAVRLLSWPTLSMVGKLFDNELFEKAFD